MRERPNSVTVVCWIMIVLSGVSLVTTTLDMNDPTAKELMGRSPIPNTIQVLRTYADLLVTLVTGIAMLRGQNWARLLFVIYSAIGLAIGLATTPKEAAIIPGIMTFVLLVVLTFFLFRPSANEYFKAVGREAASSDT